MPKESRAVLLWCLWIGTGLSLNLTAWAALRTIPTLAADPPGGAGAIALMWIHGSVLPPLFAGGSRWASHLLLGFGVALVGVPVALVLAIVSGFLVMDIPLKTIIALSPPQNDFVARQETGFVLRIIFELLSYAMATAPAFGGSVAALSAGGIAAAIPTLCRPRMSWRVALSGAWSATILLMPEWWTPWLDHAWRTPVLFFTAAFPPLLLVSWRDMRGTPP